MKLPAADRARVDPEKVRDYLLSGAHPVGRFKATFFSALGYSEDAWEKLRDDLLDIARRDDALPGGPSPHGEKYEVRATLHGPNGRTAKILSVWMVRSFDGETFPRFVTAFPV